LQDGDDFDTEASEGGGSSLARLDDFGGDECDELHEAGEFEAEDGAPESSAEPSNLSEDRDGGG
jgi:hypothetical protein